jgi:F-type H+-transporting ATPase subunit b
MKRDQRRVLMISLASAAVIHFLVYCPDVLAAGALSSGRKLWNNIMLWVNFGILAFFFIKFARKPLVNYLRGVGKEVEKDLGEVEDKYEELKSLRDAELKKLDDIQERIEEIKKHIIALGIQEKEKIVEQGKVAAEKLIQDAHAYSDHRMLMAKRALSHEMLDIAFSMVEKRLTGGISAEENERIIDQVFEDIETAKQHLS